LVWNAACAVPQEFEGNGTILGQKSWQARWDRKRPAKCRALVVVAAERLFARKVLETFLSSGVSSFFGSEKKEVDG